MGYRTGHAIESSGAGHWDVFVDLRCVIVIIGSIASDAEELVCVCV